MVTSDFDQMLSIFVEAIKKVRIERNESVIQICGALNDVIQKKPCSLVRLQNLGLEKVLTEWIRDHEVLKL